ncbi:methyl-accepting chemotaxis protein [Desulfovibrio sp. OttesenSCG-928-O18]|nr:methyl-accepting chemotaxis protein [Desulfovibrio sp. OttesenSCG-928-O18]
MTTKWKIITGFVVMVTIVGAVVLLGYMGIQRSSEGFSEYRRLARLNVATSELEVSLNSATSDMFAYVNSKDEKLIVSAKNNTQQFVKLLDENEQFTQDPEVKKLYASLRTEIQELNAIIDSVHTSTIGNDKQYRDVVLPAARSVMTQLQNMAKAAEGTRNHAALSGISVVWNDMTLFMSGISRYANSHAAEDATLVTGYIEQMLGSLTKLEAALPSEAGLRDIAALKSHHGNLKTAFNNMQELSTTLMENLKGMNSLITATIAKTEGLSETINTRMLDFGSETLQNNSNAQKYMLATGSVGLVLGILIALVIVLGIIKVLKEVAGFAGAVADGDFTYQIKVREKGEIGGMVDAMRDIPAVLERIITIANNIADSIRKGELRSRFDTAALSGSFSGLGTAINTVCEAYTGLIDAMPIPVMACDKNLHIVFANSGAQSVLGGEQVSMSCSDQMKAPECNGDQCIGKRAMAGKTTMTTETTVYPQGKRMEVAVTAIPSFDINGEAAGFIEIITDLTEIKMRQATMLKVAQDASDISDRVAAASEQLAAQVEQISRGAEIQRERVETTASAMSEMNATVLEVARSAGQASEQSDGTRGKAEQGADLVDKVVGAIHRVNEVGQKLHENMQELGTQAESIGGVMNVISDIADQTNLLALNAAIEAARAGEAGRGFAVVADEVRKLAEKTMEATHEVGSNITAIQHSAKINQEEVNHAVTSVGEATELANASGEALKEIVDLAAANSSVVASIATAAEEQSATSEEINASIDEINRITGETTDGMVQSSEAVQELSRMAQELRRVMEGLR